MLLSFPWFFFFLAFAPRCVFALFEFFAYSGVHQCGHFNISFSGGQPPAALPLTLTVIPFGSTPLSFTLPESAWDSSTSSGSYVTVLPLPAGISLLASLDDAAGNNAAVSSDVIQVQPSTDTSCISANQTSPAVFQLADDAVSQCSPFNVSRNTSSSDHSISVRVFIPGSLSFSLRWINFHTSQGVDTFTYIIDVASGLRVAMLFDDGQGTRQVSDLISVGGGVSSPSGCLQTSSAQDSTATQAGVGGLSRSAISAIASFARLISSLPGLHSLLYRSLHPLLSPSSSFLAFSSYAVNGANSPDVSTRMPKTERPMRAVHSSALYHPSLPKFLQEFPVPQHPWTLCTPQNCSTFLAPNRASRGRDERPSSRPSCPGV